MILPENVQLCLDKLENAGFAAFAVGGCVRDSLLGLTPNDYDLCTSALPEQTRAVFSDFQLVLAGEKHGTVGVVTANGVIEITTFRTEGGYQDHRHPDWVKFVPRVEEDLARRDFTVNAMAYSPSRGFADPFGGREDLKNHVLRAVGDPAIRFQEDSLRILRGARFALRFGLIPETETEKAMTRLAPLMEELARERVFDELCKLIPLCRGEDLLRYAPILGVVIPELVPTFGFDQRNHHHTHDLFTHIALVTERVPPELPLRWAALLHDVGKVPCFSLDEQGQGHFIGHAKVGAQMAEKVLLRLKAPTALRERVVFLIARHMTPLEPDRKLLRRRLSQYGPEATFQLLQLQQADFTSKGAGSESTYFLQIRQMLDQLMEENTCLSLKDLEINGKDLMELGVVPGPEIGRILNVLLSRVLDETLPNQRRALLDAVKSIRN